MIYNLHSYFHCTSSLLRVNNLSELVGNASSSVLVFCNLASTFVSPGPDYKHVITILQIFIALRNKP